MKLTRRHLLALGLTAFTGGALVVAAGAVSRRAGGPGIADLGRMIGEPELWSAQRIGRAWLRAHPAESDPAELERLLAPLPGTVRNARSLRHPAVLAWLRPRQRSDFAADRIVELEGWWLSQTEARFCALLSLC